MAIEDQDDLILQVENLLGGSASLVSDDGKEQSVTQAIRELGWPADNLTDDFKCYWLVERTKRHMIYVLMLESAHKFRFKQIHLQQRFANYIKLVEKMDADFNVAIEDNPQLFPVKTVAWAGDFIPAGFITDQLGRDLTYL